MRPFRLGVLALFAVSPMAIAQPPPAPVPVLLELFTSEGCSSCPPADAALARLVETQPVPGAQIVPLGFHVDYWNRLGWKDPYSSGAFSFRQEQYAQAMGHDGVYTPQMVVDGTHAFVGNEAEAVAAVAKQARAPHLAILLDLRADSARVTARVDLGAPLPAGARVWVALTEAGISTRVERGENEGRTLHHTAVVRALHELPVGAATKETSFELDGNLHRDRVAVVAFVQDGKTMKVLGAVQRPLEPHRG